MELKLKKETAKKFPASYVYDKTGNTDFYLDKAAAGLLPNQTQG